MLIDAATAALGHRWWTAADRAARDASPPPRCRGDAVASLASLSKLGPRPVWADRQPAGQVQLQLPTAGAVWNRTWLVFSPRRLRRGVMAAAAGDALEPVARERAPVPELVLAALVQDEMVRVEMPR